MTAPSDALVVFGVTGDLAFKQIFPALHAMVQARPPRRAGAGRGPGRVEPRGAARPGEAQHRGERRVRSRGVREAVGAAPLRRRRLRRRGDLQGAAPGAGRCVAAHLLPGDSAQPVRHRGLGPGRRGHAPTAHAWWSRSRSAATSPRPRRSTPRCASTSPRRRSSASTTTWARSRCRTSSTTASPTRSSSRSGTATTSTGSRSRWPSASASRAAASSTRRPARSATSCRTTCCRSSACWRSRRRAAAAPSRCATRRRRPSARCGRWPPPTSCAASSAATASEPGVAADSMVETFAAVRLYIDSWRWAGVPFYIRAGKHLPVTTTEVLVELKRPPVSVFPDCDAARANHFRFRLSPQVVLSLGARAKTPGEGMHGEDVDLIACHNRTGHMTPYERLLGDAMRGDQTLFGARGHHARGLAGGRPGAGPGDAALRVRPGDLGTGRGRSPARQRPGRGTIRPRSGPVATDSPRRAERRVYADDVELAEGAAQLVAEGLGEAIAADGRGVLALSGGSTPRQALPAAGRRAVATAHRLGARARDLGRRARGPARSPAEQLPHGQGGAARPRAGAAAATCTASRASSSRPLRRSSTSGRCARCSVTAGASTTRARWSRRHAARSRRRRPHRLALPGAAARARARAVGRRRRDRRTRRRGASP